MQKKEINILTWNINWFRGKHCREEGKYYEDECLEEVYNKIINIVDGFMERDNAIIFLQEVPYKSPANIRSYTKYFIKLSSDLKQRGYCTELNEKYNNGFLTRVTMAIYKGEKDSIYEAMHDYKPLNNQTICVKAENYTIIGVHMPTKFSEYDCNKDKTWQELISYVKESREKNERVIIVGDFNAYIGCKESLTRKRYIQLLRYVCDVVPDNIPTFVGETAIDHVLVNFDTNDSFEYSINNLDYSDSDHRYIQSKFIIEE